MLGDVVRQESPAVERDLHKLENSMNNDAKRLVSIENTILESLQNAKGSILDSEEIIEQLDHSKTLALEIKERMKEAETKKEEIMAARDQY